MKKIILLVSAFAFTSCAVSIKSIPLNHSNYSVPDEGIVQKKEIGERLIMKGEEETQDGYKITNSPDFSLTMIKYPYSAGTVLPLSGETKEWYLYFINDKHVVGNMQYTAGIAKHKQNPDKILPFINSVNGFSARKIDDFTVVKTSYNNPDCDNCFKKEFIYNGKSGNSLKFVYREYINDMARPAFNQDLQYDLADGNIIGFKGLRLEVVSATNTSIEYKILSTFAN